MTTSLTWECQLDLAPPVRVAGVASAVDSAVWLRLRLRCADPTMVRVKAWADGATEPSEWSVVAEDAEVGLQAPGAVGVRASLPGKASNAPVTLRFDDLHATIPDEASPRP